MAEAVGLVASVITLGEISFKVLQYLHTVKERDRAKEKLSTELMSICLLLQQLKVQIGEDVDTSELKPAWQQALAVLDKPGGLFERLRNELNDFERKLTSSSSRVGKAMITLRWPLTEKQVLAIVTRIAGLKADITLVVTQSNHAINRELLGDIVEVKSRAQESQLSAVLTWLSTLNFRQMQKEVFERAITGQWFADNSSFSVWHKKSSVRMLWYHGVPGAGKSFHAALAFDELARAYASANVGIFIAFSKFDIEESQTERGVVASLLKQLVQYRGGIPEKLQELCGKYTRRQKPPCTR